MKTQILFLRVFSEDQSSWVILESLSKAEDIQKMEQEQQRIYGEHPHVFHDQGEPLLRAVDEIEIQEKPAVYDHRI